MIKFPYLDTPLSPDAPSDASPEVLLGMYRSMLRIRRIEEAVEAKYHEDQMKTPIHLVIGQEATSVGACAALRQTDLLFSSHRTHGNYLAKGGDLNAMFAEFFCKSTGCSGSRGGSMHLFDKSVGMAGSSAICGGAPPIATGSALTAKLLKKDYVTTVFFGDGAAEEGVIWESLNFAALKKLPIIYFCENNFFSVCTPLDKRQPMDTELHKKAAAFGLTAERVDGTNVLQVYEATKRAVEHTRKGLGPYFIEARLYRWRAHGGAGDDLHLGYRDADEGQAWQKYCPIALFEAWLIARKLLTPALKQAMETEFAREIAAAFEFAVHSPVPTEADLATHVYAQ